VGRAVSAQTLLEGSVRRQGDRFVITAHLIDSRDGYYLWSETHDRASSDALDIQREIAAQISDALRGQVAREP
jgi:TolB-like protein